MSRDATCESHTILGTAWVKTPIPHIIPRDGGTTRLPCHAMSFRGVHDGDGLGVRRALTRHSFRFGALGLFGTSEIRTR